MMQCPWCGHDISSGIGSNCPNCGSPLPAAAPAAEPVRADGTGPNQRPAAGEPGSAPAFGAPDGTNQLAQNPGEATRQPVPQGSPFAGQQPGQEFGQQPPGPWGAGQPSVPDARERARMAVAPPAIALMVLAGLSILQCLGAAAVGVVEMSSSATSADAISIGICLLLGGFGAFVLYGANRMRQLRGYAISMATAIMVMIPCVTMYCWFPGVGVGVWALVVLGNPDVREALKSSGPDL